MAKYKELNELEILEKNPKAAKILEKYRAKLGKRGRPVQKEYGLGLPYTRPFQTRAKEKENA